MSEPKHTPGPWVPGHLSSEKCSCDCCYILSENHMGAVASVHYSSPDHCPDGDNPSMEKAKANQLLIAAAPELLAALKDVMGWIKNWDPDLIHDPEWPATDAAAEAAITKAEGGQP